MHKVTIFRDRQEVTPDDFMSTGEFAQAFLTHLIRDAVEDAKGWAGFQVIESATAEITVKPGRIYSGGPSYISETDVVFDLISSLPSVNKKWVAVVSWGSEIDTDVQPRDFVIDVTTGAAEPNAVAMQRFRRANVATVVGVEAPQPAQPAIDANNIVIAWVLINPTGIESIAMVDDNRLPQSARLKGLIDQLMAWMGDIGPQINSLRSDLARILGMLSQLGDHRLLEQVVIDVARLKEMAELEDDYTDYGADRFLTLNESDDENVNYLAFVEEGCRFALEAEDLKALALFNPINPDVAVSNGFLLPKYTEQKRFEVGPYHEALPIAQYTYSTHQMVQRTMSKTRIRYGESKTVCTNHHWWKSGKYDATQGTFYKDGETWKVEQEPGKAVKFKRLTRFWVDTYEEPYWDRIVVNHNISGQQIAQTFLNGADGWLTSIGLFFTQKGGSGNVNISLAEVKAGKPDLDALIGTVTLDVADIQTSANGKIQTKVAFPATWLRAGTRYAIVITTGGNHYVAMAHGTAHTQGTFFYSVDGAYQMGSFDKDLCFALYFAKFVRTRTAIDLSAMSLSGGITDIDIMAPMIVPESCELTFEVQIAGVWHPLENVVSGNTVLFGLPPLLPFRAIFTGTSDVQPGLNLIESSLHFSRPRTTFKHISTKYTLAASTRNFKVIALLENYKEANHDMSCKIQLNGVGTEVAPAMVVDMEIDPPVDARSADHKRIRRTFTWTDAEIAAPMSSVKIVMEGQTTSALDTWHVGERVHLAF